MLHFFDYVYYRVCSFYNKSGEQTSYKISGIVILTALYVLNLIFLCQLVSILFQLWFNINKYLIVIPYFMLLASNGIRYNKLNYNILNKKWGNEDPKAQQRKGLGVFLYILFSVIGVIILIIWRANTK
jgi:hypothetical protein